MIYGSKQMARNMPLPITLSIIPKSNTSNTNVFVRKMLDMVENGPGDGTETRCIDRINGIRARRNAASRLSICWPKVIAYQ